MGSVWRADKPQKGRFRQFTQCDIDIIGDGSIMAEIELIAATSKMLTRIFSEVGIREFTVHINDRRILKAMAASAGFTPEQYDDVFIILDKMDKIGLEGVREELEKEGFDKACVDKYLAMFEEITNDVQGVRYVKEKLEGVLEPEYADGLELIMNSVDAVKAADFKIAFDPTLVRGMSYYTGPIFEISMDEFGGSVGGGGRYDEMIGKFTGNNTCACGFSIGFERIIMLLMERGFQIPQIGTKKALLIEKNMPAEGMMKVLKQAEEDRKNGSVVTIAVMKKKQKVPEGTAQRRGIRRNRRILCRQNVIGVKTHCYE